MPPSEATATTLDAKLRAAHAACDRTELVSLYLEASQNAPDPDARGFYLTHAYVFALDAGDPRAAALKSELVALGRDR